jgi:hypothetical protein
LELGHVYRGARRFDVTIPKKLPARRAFIFLHRPYEVASCRPARVDARKL